MFFFLKKLNSSLWALGISTINEAMLEGPVFKQTKSNVETYTNARKKTLLTIVNVMERSPLQDLSCVGPDDLW